MADLAVWRARLNITQEQVAEQFGFSTRTLRRWERNELGDPGIWRRKVLATFYAELEAKRTGEAA